MKAHIVYCHPDKNSFTSEVFETVKNELSENRIEYEVSDLYEMKFSSDMTIEEYCRESNYASQMALAEDVIEEQRKINASQILIFIYPVFWTEAPSKLVGWFDRVWTFGFAYGDKKMNEMEKTIFICTAGRTIDHLKEHGQLQSMQNIMIGDRMFGRSKYSEMIILDSMSKANPSLRESKKWIHLAKVKNTIKDLVDKS